MYVVIGWYLYLIVTTTIIFQVLPEEANKKTKWADMINTPQRFYKPCCFQSGVERPFSTTWHKK